MTTKDNAPGQKSGMERAITHFGKNFEQLVKLRMRAAIASSIAEIVLVPHPWPQETFRRLTRGIYKAAALYLQVNALGKSLDSGAERTLSNSLESMISMTLNYTQKNWSPLQEGKYTSNESTNLRMSVSAKHMADWSRTDIGDMQISIYVDNNRIPKGFNTIINNELDFINKGLFSLGPQYYKPRDNWKTASPATVEEVLWDVRVRMSVFVVLFLSFYRKATIYPDPFWTFFLRPRNLGSPTSRTIPYARTGFLGYSYLFDKGQQAHLKEFHIQIDNELLLPFPSGVCGSVFLQGVDSDAFLANVVINTYKSKNSHISDIECRMLKDRVLLELPVYVVGLDEIAPDGPELILVIAIPLPKKGETMIKASSLKLGSESEEDEADSMRIERLSQSPCLEAFSPGEFQILRQTSGRLINDFVRTPVVFVSDDVLIGTSKEMLEIVYNAKVLSQSNRPVLILGPSGSGKTTLAREMHKFSGRRGPFASVSGASLSHDIARSEIFGHQKWAFTGALAEKQGILEYAAEGTLFIDDFDVLPTDVQAMLLSVMEGGSFRQLGETKAHRYTNAKFILATNADLEDLIAKGMRLDFLYRMAAHMTMPSLNQRRGDIPELVNYFVKEYVKSNKGDFEITVSPAGNHLLKNNDWSNGEVRALRYTVEMACTKLIFEAENQVIKALQLEEDHIRWAITVRLTHNYSAPKSMDNMDRAQFEINANSAALGADFSYPTVSRARFAFGEAISNIHNFCKDYINGENHHIALTNSATAACEAGLLALAPEVEMIIYTDFAHPNVVHAVKSVSRIISRLRGREIALIEVPLKHLVTAGVNAVSLAESISEALRNAAIQPAIVVLEHVTYNEGLRIPIDAICEEFEHTKNRLLIDAAQSFGVWRPRNSLAADVFGCFHKFVGAPAGTGFLALRDDPENRLAYSIGHTITQQQLDFPTTNIHKWEQASLAIQRLTRRFENPTVIEGEVNNFMDQLCQDISPLKSTLHDVNDRELRSHILSIDFSSPKQAQDIVEKLASEGVRVQQFHNRVRVSMGARSSIRDAQKIGWLLRYAAQ